MENTQANAPIAVPQQLIVGVVASDKGVKTIHVLCERQWKEPKYKKYLWRRTRLAVHDEQGLAKVGDTVEIVQCRPMSKTKRHRLLRIVTKNTKTQALNVTAGQVMEAAKNP
jgi:small subunit ribosomal protein S17